MDTLRKYRKRKDIGFILFIIGFISIFIAYYQIQQFKCFDTGTISAALCTIPTFQIVIALFGVLLSIIGFSMVLVNQLQILKNKKKIN